MQKIIYTSISLLLFSIFVYSQNHEKFTIHINLEDLPDGGRYELNSFENENICKTPTESDGTSATFTGRLETTSPLFILVIGDKNLMGIIRLFIGNEEVYISGTSVDYKIVGSETQDIHEKWRKKTTHATTKRKDAMRELLRMSQLSEVDSTYYKEQSLKGLKYREIEINLTKEFIRQHSNSETSVFLLHEIMLKFSLDTIRALYHQIPQKYKSNRYSKDIELLISIEPVKEGDKIVDFKAFDLSGETVRFAKLPDAKDKYVLLIFSSPGCGPCEMAVPELKRIYNNSHDWLELVTYSQSTSKEKLKSKAEANSIQWTYLGSEESDKTTMYSYGAYGTPKFVLLSPGQKVVYSFDMGYKPGILTSKIEEYK